MKALDLGRPQLVILEGALNLAVDMMEAHAARNPTDLSYTLLIADYRKLAEQMGNLIQYGDEAEKMGESVTESGVQMQLPCPTCKKI